MHFVFSFLSVCSAMKIKPHENIMNKKKLTQKCPALQYFNVAVYNCFVYIPLPSADCDYTYFWKWTRFRDYCFFVFILSLVGGAVTVLLLKVTVYVELLGFASLLLEACLGVPQFWKNFSKRSTEGMRSEYVWKARYFFLCL